MNRFPVMEDLHQKWNITLCQKAQAKNEPEFWMAICFKKFHMDSQKSFNLYC